MAHLTDLQTGEVVASSGIMNPQIRFGEDLMSRVSYAMMNPGGDVEMTRAVREAINTLAEEIAKEGEIDPSLIMETVFVCNPVMHHLLLGIDPVELGQAPFALATSESMTIDARDLELNALNPRARVYILPCIAGHVGADAAARRSRTPPSNFPCCCCNASQRLSSCASNSVGSPASGAIGCGRADDVASRGSRGGV